MLLNTIYMCKYYFMKWVNSLYARDRITYRTRRRVKTYLAYMFELLILSWQVYGNFIYYEWRGATDDNDTLFQKCMDEKNNGFEFSMFMLLILGYSTLLLYILVLSFVIYMYCRRHRVRANRESTTSRILRSISRVTFKEEVFGAISDQNECVICLNSYQENENITKLRCNENHYFHSGCIENWIRQGGNKCPICRTHILAEDQRRISEASFEFIEAGSDASIVDLGAI